MCGRLGAKRPHNMGVVVRGRDRGRLAGGEREKKERPPERGRDRQKRRGREGDRKRERKRGGGRRR